MKRTILISVMIAVGVSGLCADLHADPPEVVSYNLGFYAYDVPGNTDLVVEFSTDMDAATINDSTFVAVGTITGRNLGLVTYDVPTRTATLDPDRDFITGEVVTVVVSDSIKSSDEQSLVQGYVWQFNVGATQGTGLFVDGGSWTTIEDESGRAFVDMNADGYLDIVGLDWSGNILIGQNDGSGSFDSLPIINTGFWAVSGFVAGEFNEDELFDFGWYSTYYDEVTIKLNEGDGTFTDGYYWRRRRPSGFSTADLNGDCRWDMIQRTQYLTASDSGGITIVYNSGSGNFDSPYDWYGDLNYIPSMPDHIVDLDNDSDLDMIWFMNPQAYNRFNPDYRIRVLRNIGTPYYFEVDSVYAPFAYDCMKFADFNGDGYIDFCYADSNQNPLESITIQLNDQNGNFSVGSRYSIYDVECTFPPQCYKLTVRVLDFNHDGLTDIAAWRSNWDTGCDSVFFLYGNGDGTVTDPVAVAPSTSNYSNGGLYYDLDSDGDMDIVYTDPDLMQSDELLFLLNLDTLPPGDADGSGFVDIDDIVYLIAYIFSGGPAPTPDECYGDADGSGGVDIDDVVYLIAYVFSGGPAPVEIC